VVPELRASLVNLEKPTFEDDAKEEAAMCAPQLSAMFVL
jgi:hypothetical protein